MIDRFTSRFSSLTLLALTFASAVAFAEQNPAADADIEEMVVIAHHTPVPSHLVGSSVSLLDTQDFADRHTLRPQRLVAQPAQPEPIPNRDSSAALLRSGCGAPESNHTLVLIDGIEANRSGQWCCL